MNWRDDAACDGYPGEWFFPEGRPAAQLELERRAKEVCRACRVKVPCLNAALDQPMSSDWGIWGETNPSERVAIRQRRRARTGRR